MLRAWYILLDPFPTTQVFGINGNLTIKQPPPILAITMSSHHQHSFTNPLAPTAWHWFLFTFSLFLIYSGIWKYLLCTYMHMYLYVINQSMHEAFFVYFFFSLFILNQAALALFLSFLLCFYGASNLMNSFFQNFSFYL